MMQGEAIPPAYAGQELEEGYVELFKKPVYDIVIKPQKRSPYSKMSQNELAKELYNMGFFNPQLAEQSMTALELMDFDGIESVKDKVQQGQTLLNTVNQLAQELAMIKGAMGMGAEPAVSAPRPQEASSGGKSIAQAQKAAQSANMTSYGERLAKRAQPDMNAQ
jgi:ribosomal protein S16